MRFWMSVLPLLLLISCTAKLAAQEPAFRQRVYSMVSNFEQQAPAEAWKKVGPAAVPVLVSIADDTKELRFRRLQAIAALSHFGEPEGTTFLRSTFRNTVKDSIFRRAALRSLVARKGDEALPDLKRALQEDNARMREVAVQALSRLGSREATDVLRQHLRGEREEPLRRMIEAGLGRVGSGPTR